MDKLFYYKVTMSSLHFARVALSQDSLKMDTYFNPVLLAYQEFSLLKVVALPQDSLEMDI